MAPKYLRGGLLPATADGSVAVQPLTSSYEPKNALQISLRAAWRDSQVILLTGEAGTGKAQPLDAVIITPSGPKKMGDIKVGDKICAVDGSTTTVTGVFPQGVRKVFKVRFSDGSSTECCEDHLWEIRNDTKKWTRIFTTKQLSQVRTYDTRKEFQVPITKAVQFEKKDFVIDPYFMGVILAEGSLNGKLAITNADPEVIDRVQSLLSDDYKMQPSPGHTYSITKKSKKFAKNVYIQAIKAYGLENKRSWEKHIPEDYLHASVEQRIDLLRGMMDGDGTVTKKSGMPVYYTTSSRLADDFEYLVNSLGGVCSRAVKKTSYYSAKYDKRVYCKDCYVLHVKLPNDINPFYLSRKASAVIARTKYPPKRYVVGVDELGEKEMQCISVDHASHLYLTDRFIVTHNTSGAMGEALQDLLDRRIRKIIVTRPPIPNGPSIGFLTGDLQEKMLPWLSSISDSMSGFTDATFAKLGFNVEITDLGMIQGRTVRDAVLIVDEASNIVSRQQLVCLATRVGKNGKIVLCGDPAQSNLRADPNPFAEFAIDHANTPGVTVLTATREDQLRSGFVKDFLEVEEELQKLKRRLHDTSRT